MALIDHIEQELSAVMDPETNLNIVDMGLIKDIMVDESSGKVTLTFSPSSPVCPMAFKLGADIKRTIENVEGVSEVELHVENYNRARELEELLRTEKK